MTRSLIRDSVPRRTWPRRKKLAAALALSTITGLACLTQVSTADAEVVGGATITVDVADMDNWSAGWSAAYAECRSSYPSTKSVQMLVGQAHPSDPTKALQVWECHDTP